MNLQGTSRNLRGLAFRTLRVIAARIPGGRISAFGDGRDQIGKVLVINLGRQPRRLRRVMRELARFQTAGGAPLTSLVRRLAAVDARDGRAVATTADVDPIYPIGNQLFVQPDARLEECFGSKEPIRMTRQEVAVARSHIEAWKAVANGPNDHVLILEDDVWFRRGAAAAIDRGWRAANRRSPPGGGPRLLYLSYADAGGSAVRADPCEALFRPERGLWFLSGYVLSRDGAATLLRAMPVVGPVDMWINFRFGDLRALALSAPAILQRPDGTSDNSYSVLPFLARAGVVDAPSERILPDGVQACKVLAWTVGGECESVAMALSMLGFRVRTFDGNEPAITARDLPRLLEEFDALVDAPLASDGLSAAIEKPATRFIVEAGFAARPSPEFGHLPDVRTIVLSHEETEIEAWGPLCGLLGVERPVQAFPVGSPRGWRTFHDDRPPSLARVAATTMRRVRSLDASPWVLVPEEGWPTRIDPGRRVDPAGERLVGASMVEADPAFPASVETFPGNLAAFSHHGISHDAGGTRLRLSQDPIGSRSYRSGAFASVRAFGHGRYEAEIRAARGPGLVTGLFLHRASPFQEIDVELTGNDVRRLLVNVYFNPGDDGADLNFGYRGSPCRIDLDFDATLDFHLYAIDWRPGRIAWFVDGNLVHERGGWNPTPIPHLPMRLHANLWAPRSEELAGRLDPDVLPATASFRNVSIFA